MYVSERCDFCERACGDPGNGEAIGRLYLCGRCAERALSDVDWPDRHEAADALSDAASVAAALGEDAAEKILIELSNAGYALVRVPCIAAKERKAA